jgi:hypothetical protein
MSGNAATLFWSGDNPGNDSLVALAMATVFDACSTYWTFFAALNMGLARRGALSSDAVGDIDLGPS